LQIWNSYPGTSWR